MTDTEPENIKSSARLRADTIKDFQCKNLIAVIEDPKDFKNIGTIIRNANALGVEKVYVVDPRGRRGKRSARKVPLPTVIERESEE